jgi:SAM-dependent methyltransferase
MGSDTEWEKWGRQDPYFGVLTDERFRTVNLDDDSFESFFLTGEQHVDALCNKFSRSFAEQFNPRNVLDYGCGTGRLSVAFAKRFEHVTGVDVAASMIDEARTNRESSGLDNLEFRVCRGDFGDADDQYDLVNSYIVMQHIPRRRGMTVVGNLLQSVAPGGFIALHLTFGNKTRTNKPLGLALRLARSVRRKIQPDPEMLMTAYDLNDVMELLLRSGFVELICELTDQAGSYGINIMARRDAQAVT